MKTIKVKFIILLSILFFSSFPLFAANTATRVLPATYTPGGTINVQIDVIAPDKPTGIIVVETLPAGWVITSSTPNYFKPLTPPIFTSSPTSYSWLTLSASGVAFYTIKYTVSVPSDATGVKEISGILNITKEGIKITINTGGNTSIQPAGATSNKGDIDQKDGADITDVILCLRMSVKLNITVNGVTYPYPYNPTFNDLADMNNDGDVDITDVILILRKSVGLI